MSVEYTMGYAQNTAELARLLKFIVDRDNNDELFEKFAKACDSEYEAWNKYIRTIPHNEDDYLKAVKKHISSAKLFSSVINALDNEYNPERTIHMAYVDKDGKPMRTDRRKR